MTGKQLDVFESFLGPRFSAETDIITSVMYAFASEPKRGLTSSEFDNLVCELCKCSTHFYPLSDHSKEVIRKLVFINKKSHMDFVAFCIVWKHWIKHILSPKSVLLVLNMQNDLLHGKIPGLSGPLTHNMINKTNTVLRLNSFELVIYVMENHPPHHISFVENLNVYQHLMSPTGDVSEFDDVTDDMDYIEAVNGHQESLMDRIDTNFTVWDKVIVDTSGAAEEESCGEESEILLWPMHCVENTWGSDLSPQLHMAEKTLRVYTGTNPMGESCSPFWDWEGVIESNLLECLRLEGVTDVYVCGVPTDIAIVPTVLDCINHGLRAVYIADASLGLDELASEECETLLRSRGVTVVNSDQVASMLKGEDRRPEMLMHSAINFAQAMKKLNLQQSKNNASSSIFTN